MNPIIYSDKWQLCVFKIFAPHSYALFPCCTTCFIKLGSLWGKSRSFFTLLHKSCMDESVILKGYSLLRWQVASKIFKRYFKILGISLEPEVRIRKLSKNGSTHFIWTTSIICQNKTSCFFTELRPNRYEIVNVLVYLSLNR
jgi:hypothetical protein